MDIQGFADWILDLLLLPLQLVLVPIDALLSQINGISAIPTAISNIVSYIATIPSTLVTLLGINPFLWNMLFLTFLLYMTATPGINMIKKVWAWIRP